MPRNKFLPFLIVSLVLTAFLAGYIMVSRGLDSGPKSKTGTILDKFGDQQAVAPDKQVTEEIGFFPISSVKVVSISNTLNREGVTYFEKNTGKLFEYNFEDKKEQVVSDAVLPNFLSSIWSPLKREVLSLFYSPASTQIKYHSYNTGKTINLNSNIRSISFSPDGGLITYYLADSSPIEEPAYSGVGSDPSTRAGKIYIAQTDGTYPKKILDTRISDLNISWPIKDKISFSTPTAEVFLLTEEGQLTKLLEPRPGLDTKWSPNGSKLLFSYVVDINNPVASLWLKDVESKLEKDLNTSTLASRCVWSIDAINIFCAIAKTPTSDDIYQINTVNGFQKLVAEPGVLIGEVLLTAVEDVILFTNLADEKLYGVKLED